MRVGAVILGLLLATGCPPSTDKDPTDGTVSENESCVTCHDGIEQVHSSIPEGKCVVCHGGDGEATTVATAHVAVPANYLEIRGDGLPPAPDGYIKDLAADQLGALDPDFLRFKNPGDIRVADQTCAQCHPDHVAQQKNSVMTTNAGHYMPTLFLAGMQDRDAIYGSYGATDPECENAEPTEDGAVCELTTLVPPPHEDFQAAVDAGDLDTVNEIAYAHYLSKNCGTCHQAGSSKDRSAHLYRSTGCTACHMVMSKDGVYEGNDPTISKSTPTHVKEHVITKAIPTEQCATCHFQGGRIGILFRGLREGGFSEDDTPENAVPWAESAYDHPPGYYFTDEDSTNGFDETPPDVHYAAGMHCADCHVGSDVHGDGRIYSTSKQQVDLQCEDCHGTVRGKIVADAGGFFRTSKGRVLPQLSTGPEGYVVLTGIVDGAEHIVPQVNELLAEEGSHRDLMRQAMAPNGDDWSHTDDLKCDACHTSFNQFCIGCHVSVDMRLTQVDNQTGLSSRGLTRGSRETYSISHTLLGVAPDGRVQSVMPSQQVQMTVIDADGNVIIGQEILDDQGEGTGDYLGEFRVTSGSDANNGFHTFFQHTTTDQPRDCTTCHRQDETDDELTRVKGVYGYGTGEFMLDNPLGDPVDALQYLDEDGNDIVEWVHDGGALPEDRRNRAIGVILDDLE